MSRKPADDKIITQQWLRSCNGPCITEPKSTAQVMNIFGFVSSTGGFVAALQFSVCCFHPAIRLNTQLLRGLLNTETFYKPNMWRPRTT